jgi:hypothetical protein
MRAAVHGKIWPLCLSVLLCQTGQALALPGCAASISELTRLLGEPAYPVKWEETSMDDGKPLRVSILEKDGALWLEFFKTGQGLWAQTAGVICRAGNDYEIRFGADQIRFGPAAHWVLRLALGSGGKFTLSRLGPNQLRIVGGGWQGVFVPVAGPSSAGVGQAPTGPVF